MNLAKVKIENLKYFDRKKFLKRHNESIKHTSPEKSNAMSSTKKGSSRQIDLEKEMAPQLIKFSSVFDRSTDATV